MANLSSILERLDNSPTMMGCYFRMIPFEGNNYCFTLQQFEYSFERMQYKLHNCEKSVPVMPGAGSCYRRISLVGLYGGHSGRRNGEDREITIIGLQSGFKTFYAKEILALTRPPLSFRALYKQRVRWNLGFIEILYKYRSYYFKMLLSGRRIGIHMLQEISKVITILLIPIWVVALGLISIKNMVITISITYIMVILHFFYLFISNPTESAEIRKKGPWLLIYPLFWTTLRFLAWWKAIAKFVMIKNKKEYLSGIILKPYGKTNLFKKSEINGKTMEHIMDFRRKKAVLEEESN